MIFLILAGLEHFLLDGLVGGLLILQLKVDEDVVQLLGLQVVQAIPCQISRVEIADISE